MPRAFLQRSRLRLLTVAAWSGLRPAPASRFRGAHPHLPRSCTTPVYLMLPPFCVSLQHTVAEEVEAFLSGVSQRSFRLIDRHPELGHHRLRPRQCLRRATAAEDDEVVGIGDDVSAERVAA